jgi:sporulation protein YqfC
MLIYNDNTILLKNYKSILYMDEKSICIDMNDYHLYILGQSFEIEYISSDECMMKGKIKVIECHEDRV